MGKRQEVNIEFYENNSGGATRLDASDWIKLTQAGWKVEGRRANKAFACLEQAKKEFQSLTGWDPETPGCSCCGRPFCFYETCEDL